MLLNLNDCPIATDNLPDGCFLCFVVHLVLEFIVFKILVKAAIYFAKTLRRQSPCCLIPHCTKFDSCSGMNRTHCSAFSCIPRLCCPKRRDRFRRCEKQRKKRLFQQCPVDQLCSWVHHVLLPPPLPLHKPSNSHATEVADNESASVALAEAPDATAIDHNTLALPVPRRPKTHLMDLTRVQQWDAIIQQPKLKRREAKHRDTEGLYPLHWAAAGPAPHAVLERLLDVYPSAARRADAEGSLPLHFAAHYGASKESVALLHAAHPPAARRQDVYGRTPLYHAADKQASLEVLQLLSRDDPSVIVTPCYTSPRSSPREEAVRTPLYLMWAKVLQERRQQGKQWDKAVWMLNASYMHQHRNQEEETSLLTVCISMDLYLPTPTVSMVLQYYPDTSSLPIITAASTPSYSLTRAKYLLDLLLHSTRIDAGNSIAHDVSMVVTAAVQAGQPWPILQVLLPWVSSTASNMPLAVLAAMAQPLHYSTDTPALPSVWDPLALRRQAKEEELPAQEQHPAPQQEEEEYHVETIYQLLRRDPAQIQPNYG